MGAIEHTFDIAIKYPMAGLVSIEAAPVAVCGAVLVIGARGALACALAFAARAVPLEAPHRQSVSLPEES